MMKKKTSRATTINDLPEEILLKIFLSLSLVDLVNGASQVCTAWRSTCRDPDLWKRPMDLNQINSRPSITPIDQRVWTVERCTILLMMILKKALILGGGNMTTLVFHLYMLLRGDHLLYAAKRSPNVRRLVLSMWHLLDNDRFEESVKHWKELESLTLPCAYHPSNMIRSIGTHCKNFVELKLMCPLVLDLANAIVMNLPQLKVLCMPRTRISRQCLVYLLKNMKNLEELNLYDSTLVDDYLIYEIRDLFDPFYIEREIFPLATGLKKFVPWAKVHYRW